MKKRVFPYLTMLLGCVGAAAQTVFPTKFTAPAEHNTGTVHVEVLSRTEHQMTANFLFERGSRNSWHYHPGATQVLMVLSGEGYYQEQGKAKRLIRKGDVVVTPPDVHHWNGATPYSDVECMTVTDIVPGQEHVVQLSLVSDDEFAAPVVPDSMIMRIAEIEVYPQHLPEYLACAREVDRLSMEREPGVVCLLPMQCADDSTQIRIVEVYASPAAYQSHLATDHFQRYKQQTLHMVKSLKLPTMRPLDAETMQLIFRKQW